MDNERIKDVRVTIMTHHTDWATEGDCQGWDRGDSGGLVMRNPYPQAPNPYVAKGIVTASTDGDAGDTCEYSYSAFGYLRDWNANISF